MATVEINVSRIELEDIETITDSCLKIKSLMIDNFLLNDYLLTYTYFLEHFTETVLSTFYFICDYDCLCLMQ